MRERRQTSAERWRGPSKFTTPPVPPADTVGRAFTLPRYVTCTEAETVLKPH